MEEDQIGQLANEDSPWWEEPEEQEQRFAQCQLKRDWLAKLIKKAKPLLSKRERGVLLLFVKGYRIFEIAAFLGINPRNVREYQSRFAQKFGIVTDGLSTGSKKKSPEEEKEREGGKAPLFSSDRYVNRMLHQGKRWTEAEKIHTGPEEWRSRNLRQFGPNPVFPDYRAKPFKFYQTVKVEYFCPKCGAEVKENDEKCWSCKKRF